MPSALLLILGGDFPGLVAVTPVPAAAAKSAYAVNDPGNLGEGMSLGFAINASGEVFGRSHRDKGVFSKRDRHERGNRGQPPPRARVPARTQLVTTARTYHPHHLAERTDTGGGPPWEPGTGPVRVVPQPDPQDYTLDAEGYVSLTVASGRPANSSFSVTLWASDGTTTQTETVPVVIQSSCKRHY